MSRRPWLPLLAIAWVPLELVAPGDPRAAAPIVELRWTAPAYDWAKGERATYDLRIARDSLTAGNYGAATTIVLPPPSQGGVPEAASLALPAAAPYYLALTTLDDVGNRSALSNVVRATPASGSRRAIAYRCRGRDAGGYLFDQRLYGAPDAGDPIPAAPGQRQTVYIAMASPWSIVDPEGVDLAISAQWADGNWSEPFAAFRVAIVASDSVYFLARTDPRAGRDYGGVRIATWPEPPELPRFLRLESQEAVQRAERARLCALYGYWCLWGARQGCP